MNTHQSGFVSISGRPNAGKSTLLNALVGQKVAIVADKPQTTRTAIQGVLTTPEAQVVFIDTPGIHKSDSAINKRMMDAVRASLEERDVFIYLVDATKPFTDEDEQALSILRRGEESAGDPRVQQDRRSASRSTNCCRCWRSIGSTTISRHTFRFRPQQAKASSKLRE